MTLPISHADLASYENEAILILEDLTSDWEDLDAKITRTTKLIDELGFESIDVVHLITAIEQKFDRRDLPFEKLLMIDGRYKDDITVNEIASFLHEHL